MLGPAVDYDGCNITSWRDIIVAERRRGLGRGLGALIPSGVPTGEEAASTDGGRTSPDSTVDASAERDAKGGDGPRPSSKKSSKSPQSPASGSEGTTQKKNAAPAKADDKKTSKTPAKKPSETRRDSSLSKDTAGGESRATEVFELAEATAVTDSKASGDGAASQRAAGPDSLPSSTASKGESRLVSGPDLKSAKGSATDVSRETSAAGKAPGTTKERAKPTRKRRDMVQALRSTTSVSRPVDMFFLSSGDHAEPTEVQEQTASGTDDVSRETSAVKDSEADQTHMTADLESTSSDASQPSRSPEDSDGSDKSAGSGGPTSGAAAQPKAAERPEVAGTDAGPAAAATKGPAGSTGPDDAGEGRVAEESSAAEGDDLQSVPGARFAEIPVKDIHPNRKQPRQVFDEDELAELAFSVKELGVLQPIVVRPSREEGEGNYELVMGERRWRAVQEAGLDVIPAIIRDTADNDLLRDALLENLHRAQLNPLEEAAAYQQLMEEFGATQEQLSERIGRSRPQISNTLRLLRLPALVQRRVAAGVLSSGHARALLALSDPAEMERLAQRIVAEGLSVRATEEAVALADGLKRHATKRKAPANRHDDRLGYIADAFSDKLDTSVKIQLGARKGKMTIEFASVEDLNRIIDVLDPKLDPEA